MKSNDNHDISTKNDRHLTTEYKDLNPMVIWVSFPDDNLVWMKSVKYFLIIYYIYYII